MSRPQLSKTQVDFLIAAYFHEKRCRAQHYKPDQVQNYCVRRARYTCRVLSQLGFVVVKTGPDFGVTTYWLSEAGEIQAKTLLNLEVATKVALKTLSRAVDIQKSAISGHFVSKAYAKRHPKTTIRQVRRNK